MDSGLLFAKQVSSLTQEERENMDMFFKTNHFL